MIISSYGDGGSYRKKGDTPTFGRQSRYKEKDCLYEIVKYPDLLISPKYILGHDKKIKKIQK